MKKILFIVMVLFWGMLSWSTVYYVRTDGGTCDQCNGKSDAPYPGSGSNRDCAWAHPYWALYSNGKWRIQGGDTIIIGPGSYMLGFGAPNTGWCEADGAYECDLPPLPSGPNAANPTRILGKGWDSDCSNPPELWGTQRIWNVLDLTGTSNAVIACLEITDHSGCVESHPNPSAECERDSYPFGHWAAVGIEASDSSNVTLQDLDIHGLAGTGVHAGRLSDWTVENVRIAGNGWCGWDGDTWDGNSSNSGTIYFKEWLVEWNGCGETYPGEQPHNCWAQTAGGYGDGIGTGRTGGHWIIEDSIFRYNTSDGLDLLYVRESGSKIDVRRTMSYLNAGDQFKINGSAAMENCLAVSHCSYFQGKSFTYHVDNCRAGGSAVAVSLRKGNTVSIINSTIAGEGDCLVIVECDDGSCDRSEQVIVQNNIFRGYRDFADPSDTTCYFWFDQFNYYKTQMDYNVIYNAKMGNNNYSGHDLNSDPKLVNDSLSSFDGHLQSGSPAINSGLAVGSLGGLVPSVDLEGNSRPVGSGVDRGCYEYGTSTGTAQISFNRGALYYGTAGSIATPPQTVLISNSGTGTMNWSVTDNVSWLACSPASGSGSGSGEITLTVNASGLSAGSYNGTVTVTSAQASNSPQTLTVSLTVYNTGHSSAPFGEFSTPEGGSVVRSSVPVTGWVLDDIGIDNVKIYRSSGGAMLEVGRAVLVDGARPDIEAANPGYPFNYQAGWGYMMLTNFLPGGGNGEYTFYAIATDLEGNTTTLGVKTVECDNKNAVKPFGAIETPDQGGTASGTSYRDWGWALTPPPNKIPEDGSTIEVQVDGVTIGNPVYNLYRGDVADLFPGYANSSGAFGYFDIDTTAYTNGVHTIQWLIRDDANNQDGIGSRYFTVQNAGNRPVRAAPCGRPGTQGALIPHAPQNIHIRETQRIEIPIDIPGAHGPTGMRVGKRLLPLPVGSTYDREKGIFYWQPGPGFLGRYRLVLDGTGVTVTIEPKYKNVVNDN